MRSRGFVLIEAQIFFLGLGLVMGLAAWAVIWFFSDRHRHQCEHNLRTLGEAVERHQEDHSGELPVNLESLFPEYLEAPLRCPGAEFSSYHFSRGAKAPFNPNGSPDYFLLECVAQVHERGSRPPQYSSDEGVMAP